MSTAAIYCRVSTENQEREGSSLQSQKDYCLRKACELGYDIPEDCIFSGADTDRPKLTELRRLLNELAINEMDKIRISLPDRKPKKVVKPKAAKEPAKEIVAEAAREGE